MRSVLQERFDQCNSDTTHCDVYDGEGYKKFAEFLSHTATVSVLMNSDGVALYRSSSVSIWPIWGVI